MRGTQKDFHDPRLLCEANRLRCFVQRKGLGDERPRIDFAGAQQGNSLVEGSATGADYAEFLHNNGPCFDRRGTMES